MKKGIVLIGLVCLALFSCREIALEPVENYYLFESPQPDNDSELNHIPVKYCGRFLSDDNECIIVTKYSIATEELTSFVIHKNQVDSMKVYFDMQDNKWIDKDSKDVFDIKSRNDSIILTSKNSFTIFRFSDEHKAKRINGKLVLSKKHDDFWTVKIIEMNDNVMVIKSISRFADLQKMDSITKIPSKMIDSTSFLIKPTRSEFAKFLKIKNFGEQRFYYKQ